MKTAIWTLVSLALLTTGAFAHKNDGCKSLLTMDNVWVALGKDVRLQPVFANQAQRGWRVSGASSSAQLGAQGIRDGALMTHVCGVAANDVFMKKGDICCDTDTSRQFEVTFSSQSGERKILVSRPGTP